MTRPTRAQVQEQNREVVLDVARVAFMRDGYVATSLASVAKEAGFTTGIVYSSFGSKADLAIRVLERLQSEQISALGDGVAAASTPDEVLAQVRTWAVAATASGWVRFELELLLDTINDPRLAADQTARQAAAVEQASGIVRSLLPAEAVDDETIDVLGEAAVDYAIGVAVRQITNAKASPDRFLRLLQPLLASIAN
ncbi:TetR/AcrR family transcriptional regulator [Aeromicrobium sp. P5_D10]